MRLRGPIAVLAAILPLCLSPSPATAQELSDGDYELCAVYDRDDEFVGYDSVCLERQRAALRYYGYSDYSSVYYCPYSANLGYGYSTTFYNDGRPSAPMGAYDAGFDGRPCIPNPVGVQQGMN